MDRGAMRGAAFCSALTIFIALTASACGGDGKSLTPTGYEKAQGGLYLALGDSIAAGAGVSDPKSTSYVGLVETVLRQHYNDVELRNLAVGGHTTQDLIDQQLAPAIEALRTEDVMLVTITIGGNDLNVVQNSPDAATCIADVNDPKCPVAEILVGTEQRLDRILGDLRAAAAAGTPIIIQVYPNLFSGTGHVFEQPAGQAFGKLNDVIERVAAKHDILVADPRAAFEGRGGELTHTLDATPDFHPNDAGYGAISTAFLAKFGLLD